MLKEIGLIGLGVMGKNIALNLSEKGVVIKGFNKSKDKLYEINEEFSDNFEGFTDLDELVKNLSVPRTILLMVPSGEATREVIEKISNSLEENDLVIDGGNSYYFDSEDNGEYLSDKSIDFIGMGVSGGEEGARKGPAIMVGYKTEISNELKNTLSSIAAKAGKDCIGFYKGYGSGHFVKMVHNGIEYAEMQLIAEIYQLLKSSNKTNEEIANFFDGLNDENRSSYLIEITSQILRKKEDEVSVIDKIKPVASNKGTGKLTVETSLNLKVPVPSIYAAYDARVQSNNKNEWATNTPNLEGLSEEDLSDCLYFGRVASMIQGLELIKKYDSEINLGDVLNNWSGGCIIRSNLLSELNDINKTTKNLLGDKNLNSLFQNNLSSTKKVLSKATVAEVATPVLSASFNWYINLTTLNNPSNLIQAQRDYFGRHTVQFINSNEDVNIDWN